MGRASPELLDSTRYAFMHELQTRFSDVDPNQHINNVAMIAAFEDARVRFDTVVGLRAFYSGLRVMVVGATIDYLAEAFYPAPLLIHVGVLAIGRTSWTVGELAMQGDHACAYCRATLVATHDGRPTPLPQEVRDGLSQSMLAPIAD